MSKDTDHMKVWQRWIVLGAFVDALAIYGVVSLVCRDGDHAAYAAFAFLVITGALLVVAFVDARLEARDRQRNLRPHREPSYFAPDYWLDELL